MIKIVRNSCPHAIRKPLSGKLILLTLLVLMQSVSFGQTTKKLKAPTLTRIEFLFDASQSMYGQWQSGAKIDIAKSLMKKVLDSLRYVDNLELALRVYGHQKPYPPQDCDDSRLEVPFSKGNISTIQEVLKNLIPKGTTPIAKSLELCGNDFPQSPSRNIVILVTDGIEECGGDPCAISAALQKKGIFLKPFVIGMGIDESWKKTFECVGRYFDATNEITFKQALDVVISQALNSTTMQVNLLDMQHNPTETNVNMTFYDRFSGEIKYNFIHTLNSKGNPDTLVIDPLPIYKIVVHTIPSVYLDSIVLTPGKHTIVGIDAPQGFLNLKFDGASEVKKPLAIVRQHGDMKTLNVQDFNTTEKYIVGKYDLEILTLPRINLENVDISQSKTTTLQIPRPGMVTLISNNLGYGSIYVEDKNNLRWIFNMDENLNKETIVLQPGKYHVIFRPKNSKESIYTIEKDFSVVSSESNIIVLN
ncbi:MAG: VWA domain-containing protein [Bacteroidetes bacterium]|nr:VWA domain-containing protein [Bacteroidota bacterium]MBP6402879.1 VWA domain-containing protein [Bacteroidia bacterium]MBP6650335.1 VWA domain-containing protein [Bacteroidia bacterium]